MKLDRRSALLAGLAAPIVAPLAASAQTAPPSLNGKTPPPDIIEPTETIDLWPKGAPGRPATLPVEKVVERSTDPSLDRAVSGVSVPRLIVFRPRMPNGASVMIMPGGGYTRMTVDKEGYEIARWFTARGITAFVLFYRLPGDGWAQGPDTALSDAQRGVRLIKANAAKYRLDPERVAALGFSAGGHLCADLATRHAAKTYDTVDAADQLSARPRVAAPIYPVITMSAPYAHGGSRQQLIGRDASPATEAAHSPEKNVSKDTSPCFLVHAEDDPAVPPENTLMMRAALKAAKVPVEVHLFTNGGHGFGLTKVLGKPAGHWPELFVSWAATQGLI